MKLIKFIFFTLLCFSLQANLYGQTRNNPRYDLRTIHFGFSLGTNFSTLKYSFDESFYNNDTISNVNIKVSPGISLGAIINLHLVERLDLRLIPSLLLSQRTASFTFTDETVKDKIVESVYANAPLYIKYKSERHGNTRFYILAGAEYSYDIASKADSQRDFFDPNIAFKTQNLYWTYGCGFDLYFPYFKLSPEIRVTNGINDILSHHESVYSSSFSKIRNRMIMISFHFE